MAYVAPSTVTTLQTYSSSAHNIIVNDIIDHETRIKTGVESYTTAQKNALVGVTTGTTIYDSTLGMLQVWNGSVWVAASGLVFLGSTTFSSWSTFSENYLNSIFSSNFESYLLDVRISGNTADPVTTPMLQMGLSAGGSAVISSSYMQTRQVIVNSTASTTSTVSGYSDSSNVSWSNVVYLGSDGHGRTQILIQNPFLSRPKYISTTQSWLNSAGNQTMSTINFSGLTTFTTSCDGVWFKPATTRIQSGTFKVYGYL